MAIDGQWDTATETPMGTQRAVLTLKTDGAVLTGNSAGEGGTLEILNGKVDGNKLTWKMNMTVPFSLELEVTATVTGDTIEGAVQAGAFGSSPMKGTRKSS